jgi:iron complex transport system permease protein
MEGTMEIRGRLFLSVAILSVLLLVVSVAALSLGTAKIGLFEVLDTLITPGGSDPQMKMIVWGLRLPRLLMGFLVGASLALAGVVFQALLRNPLADPFILGVSSGAALGAIASSVLGLGGVFLGQKLFSFVGAMVTVWIVFRVARVKERLYPHTMLLTGVIINAFFSAAIMFLVSVARSDRVHSIFFWLMGDLSLSSFSDVLIVFLIALGAALVIFWFARPLNLLLGGEESAVALGVETERIKTLLFVLASILTAAVVSSVGVVGFVGLIVPHMLRMVVGPDHRILIPTSILFGGAFLVIADTCARTIVAPLELPVGVLTALLGAPFFIYLLRREM